MPQITQVKRRHPDFYSDDEITAMDAGPQYKDVKPSHLWGKKGSAILAQRIASTNIRRYRELVREWNVERGIEKPTSAELDGE